jgi:SAM-dependent methyltransferase
MDALDLPFADGAFDVVLLFEALYYLPDVLRFLAEARRVLRPGGRLLMATVNSEWRGFHASPLHTRYWTAVELVGALGQAGFATHVAVAFPEADASSWRNRLKTLAARYGFLPRTMRRKALLKRIFYGRLERIPSRLEPAGSEERLIPANNATNFTRYRNLYFEGLRLA